MVEADPPLEALDITLAISFSTFFTRFSAKVSYMSIINRGVYEGSVAVSDSPAGCI